MAYATNLWYVAMWADELHIGELQARTICEQPIVLYRGPEGRPVALEDRCAHRFAPLSLGRLCQQAATVECPYHGLQFDASGACVLNPHGSGRIPATLAVRAYPVVERHTLLWIWLGADEPDATLIPDYSHLDPGAEGVVSKRDWMEMAVDYQLMIDNLLDLSHAAFLHRGLLGNDGTAQAEVAIASAGRSVTVTRLSPNIDPPAMFDLMYRNDSQPVDFWSVMRWDAPSCLRHDAGVCPPGADRGAGITVIGSHLVTPSSKGKCYYHIAAVRLGEAPSEEDSNVAEQLSALRRYAFEEQDRPILEAQQRAYDAAGGPESLRPVMLSIDAGPLRARRVLATIIAAESGSRTGSSLSDIGSLAGVD
jgi:phenylpropionate dioxygenase-like ring-hydroxylating dioxygenase large terminal subunit